MLPLPPALCGWHLWLRQAICCMHGAFSCEKQKHRVQLNTPMTNSRLGLSYSEVIESYSIEVIGSEVVGIVQLSGPTQPAGDQRSGQCHVTTRLQTSAMLPLWSHSQQSETEGDALTDRPNVFLELDSNHPNVQPVFRAL